MSKNSVSETDEVATCDVVSIDKERKYTIGKPRENCQVLFDVGISAFDGATYGLAGEYTVKEIRDTLKKWGSKEAE